MVNRVLALLTLFILAIPATAADYQETRNQGAKQNSDQGNTTITVTDNHSSQQEGQRPSDQLKG